MPLGTLFATDTEYAIVQAALWLQTQRPAQQRREQERKERALVQLTELVKMMRDSRQKG